MQILAIVALLSVAQFGPSSPLLLHGVDPSRIPDSPGFNASGPIARAWVMNAQQIVRGDDLNIPDTSGSPWLILIGPEDSTSKYKSEIPEDISTRIQIIQYEPDDPRLDRGFKRYYGGGTHAIVMGPDRVVTWDGLADIKAIVNAIKRLLGIEPDPGPLGPLAPLAPIIQPLVTGGSTMAVFAFLAGLAVGVFGPAIARKVNASRLARDQRFLDAILKRVDDRLRAASRSEPSSTKESTHPRKRAQDHDS